MRLELDRARLDTIVRAVADRLEGEWLLIGGAAVALWLDSRRVTEDLDLIGLEGTAEQRYQLMNLADELGLPIEALNSAADFFVRRIPNWRSDLEVLHRGLRGVVYRPRPTLLLLLKIGRLSERDFEDCRAVLDHVAATRAPLDRAVVVSALDALPPAEDPALDLRRAELRRLLQDLET